MSESPPPQPPTPGPERPGEEMQTLALLHRVGMAVAAELDLERAVQIVTDIATELSGASFGAFFYNVVDEKGEALTLYTLCGAPREAFESFGMPRSTPIFAPTFEGLGIIRSDDITADPRYGKNAPHHGMPTGHLPVRSYLAAPVKARSGEVLGALFFGHPDAGVFDARVERIIGTIAVQAGIAVDKARLYRAAQEEITRRRRVEATLREERAGFEERLKQLREVEPVRKRAAALVAEVRQLVAAIGETLDRVAVRSDRPEFTELREQVSVLQRAVQEGGALTQRLTAAAERAREPDAGT